MTQTKEATSIKPARPWIGATATIPEESMWVTIRNWLPVRNANITYSWGDTAHLTYGGRARVLFVLPGGRVLVRYTAPAGKRPAGTVCPTGAMFVLEASEFATMTERYEARQASIAAEKKLVKQLLNHNFCGNPQTVTGGFWVDVVNDEPVRNANNTFSYGKSAVVSGGTITPRGSADGKILYEYTTTEEAWGTAAPSGILFFREADDKAA